MIELKSLKVLEKQHAMRAIVVVERLILGGSTRIPKVQQLLKEYFGKDSPFHLCHLVP
jgi:molecular chaperone DnaK (HSP70)